MKVMKRLATGLLIVGIAGIIGLTGIGTGSPEAAQAAPSTPFLKIGLAHAEHVPTLDSSKPIFILVLGDNYRKGIEASHLTDSMHIVSLNPAKKGGGILGFPRDSLANIPGHGQRKINEAYHYGGAKLAIQTIEDLTGLKMDYYAVAGFVGFKTMVSELGGVMVNVPYPIVDSHSKAHFRKGKTVMTGKEALAFTRSRYGVPNGDFSRSDNQGLFLLSMLTQFRKDFNQDPGFVFRWIGAVSRNIDSDVPMENLIQLAFTATQVPPNRVNNQVVPGTIGNKNGQSVVLITSGAKKQYRKMKDGVL